jgi:hypothetical protein
MTETSPFAAAQQAIGRRGCGLIGMRRDRMRLLQRTMGLVDRQHVLLNDLARSARQRRTREMTACIGKSMCYRSDLRLNKRCAKRNSPA